MTENNTKKSEKSEKHGKVEKTPAVAPPSHSKSKIAVVRVRGVRNMEPKIKRTLELLRLTRPNHCVLVDGTPQINGMINVVRDYVAFGPVSDDTISGLIAKRGENGSKKADPKGEHDPVFRLHPPRKGYKDIKRHYPRGDIGKRDDMDNLLKRMI